MALGAIVALAAALRLPMLGSIPPGLFLDEASRGYDAYSLWLTGRDQYGVPWPLFPEGLDDYTPALYTYLALPFVAGLGPTELAIRLPAALAGVATVGLVYLLARECRSGLAGLAAAALVTISPWHILPSRTGAEWVLLPLALTASVIAFLRGTSRPRWLIVSGALFGVTLYSYAFARLLVPLIGIVMVVAWRRELRGAWRHAVAGAIVFLVLAMPIVMFAATSQGQSRLRAVVPIDRLGPGGLVPYALANYASSFDPRFLILGTDSTYHHALKDQGPLLPVVAAFSVLGVVAVARQRDRRGLLLAWWLVAAPAASALHRESPSSALLLGAIPAWHALGGIGAAHLVATLAARGRQTIVVGGAIVVSTMVVTGLGVASDLYLQYPRYASVDWLAGARTAIGAVKSARRPGERVLVSDRIPTPHILVAYMLPIPPAEYQTSPVRVRQPNVRSHGDVAGFTFGRAEELARDLPRPYVAWVTVDEGRRLWPQLRPIYTTELPDGRPTWAVFVVGRE
jgi:4-amino-4-deoxy-L-arabinose transferase-like glycosyltransferase